MSDRLISAEKLAEILGEQWCDECMTDDCYYCNIYKIKEIVRSMPTVDAEPVRHGHWVRHLDTRFGRLLNDIIICSCCGIAFSTEDMIRRSYCPNYGAKMDEEEK